MNLDNFLDQKSLLEMRSKIKRIFFYRICGTGMGAAACLLKEAGFEVEGADQLFAPPMSDYLESTGISLHQMSEVNEEDLKKYDLIVVGNVIPGSSPEARKIEGLGVPFCSFPAALGAFVLKDKNVIGIAGTHGKTTTTYFMSQFFKNLGENPGHFVGGVIPGKSSACLGDGKYFFIESDEYDSAYFEKISKFRSYYIDQLVLTSLEFDHGDIFDSIDDIKEEFRPLLRELKTPVIFDSNYPYLVELLDEFPKLKRLTYKLKGESGPFIIEENDKGSLFKLKLGDDWYEFKTNIIGHHNILNLSSCLLLAYKDGHSVKKMQESLLSLEMVKRRQEVRGYYKGSAILDDFAHHPRSVEMTINAIKTKFPGKKISVIFEPNSATARSDLFQKEFTEAFSCSDRFIVTRPSRKTSVKGARDLDCSLIVETLNRKGVLSHEVDELSQLTSFIEEESSDENVWLVLSNGTCLGLWRSELVRELSV